MYISSPDATDNYIKSWWHGNTAQNNGNPTFCMGVGHLANTAAMTGVRFYSSLTDGFASGVFTTYGLAK